MKHLCRYISMLCLAVCIPAAAQNSHEPGSYEMLEPRHDWLWCSRPGFLNDWYCTIKVKDFIGRRKIWKNPSDYDKMMSTYRRISEEKL
ncbi:MAG: hypothetical protein MJZ07_07250 [Bacteroidales bacterium]|nr:hypothetical protein [Bacteroidales bacterium]